METKYQAYNVTNSARRIDDILNQSDTSFPELSTIPSRDKLTYKNGFYVNCSALFVDIRDSSQLPDAHNRPTLAKIYRSFTSEVVAIMNGNPFCSEVMIEGDCISAIYNTPKKAQVNSMFSDSAKIISLMKILNYKFSKKNITEIEVGIGMSYGRALIAKAGYSGSGLNEVVWMGDVVNDASNLCNNANKGWNNEAVFASTVIYNNLTTEKQGLLSWNSAHSCYHGNIVNIEMDQWYEENCANQKGAVGFLW